MATLRGHGPTPRHWQGAIDGQPIWWIAPTFPIASLIWRQLKRATRDAWIEKNEVERRIDLPGGGSVTVKSADNPDGLRGEGLGGVVIDEAAFVSERAWREAIRPSLSDRRGWCLFIGTPNGMNWYYDLFRSAETRKDWSRWQLPTSDNPMIPAEELREAELDIGLRAFAQEYLAQFTDQAGAEFSGAYFGDHAWFEEWPDAAEITLRAMALDPSLGKTDKSDYSAIVLLALTQDGTIWVDADMDRRDPVQTAARAVELGHEFQPHGFAVEANQFQTLLAGTIYEQSKRYGLALPIREVIHSSVMSKVTRIRQLTPYLSRGEIRFKRNSRGAKLLVEQLRSFPVADHDDGPDALAMAVEEARRLLIGGDGSQPERIEYLPL